MKNLLINKFVSFIRCTKAELQDSRIIYIILFLIVFGIFFSRILPSINRNTGNEEAALGFYEFKYNLSITDSSSIHYINEKNKVNNEFYRYRKTIPIKEIHGCDFYANYCSAKNYLNGTANLWGEKGTTPDPFLGNIRYSYPPLHLFVIIPFTFLDFPTSYLLWTILNYIILIVSFILISQLFKNKISAFFILILVFFFSTFLDFHIERGQTDIFALFLTSLFLYFYIVRKKSFLAGLFWSLATLFKILPGIFFLVFLLKKQYRLILISVLFSIALIFLTNVNNWITYFSQTVLSVGSGNYHDFLDYSINCIIYVFQKHYDLSSQLYIISKIILIVFLVFFIYMHFQKKAKSSFLILEFTLLLMAINLALPWSYSYKLVLLALTFLSPLTIIECLPSIRFRFILPILVFFIFIIYLNTHYWPTFIFNNLLKFQPVLALASLMLFIYLCVIYLYLVKKEKKISCLALEKSI